MAWSSGDIIPQPSTNLDPLTTIARGEDCRPEGGDAAGRGVLKERSPLTGLSTGGSRCCGGDIDVGAEGGVTDPATSGLHSWSCPASPSFVCSEAGPTAVGLDAKLKAPPPFHLLLSSPHAVDREGEHSFARAD